jgi:hypothetical protein
MAQVAHVKLGDQDYQFPRLTVGQLEELAVLWEDTDAKGVPLDKDGVPLKGAALVKHTLEVAQVVLRRASPSFADVRELECGIDELRDAMIKVLRVGKIIKDPMPGEARTGESPED